ncbi:flagellar protein FlaG [Paenibacillus sp. FSL E2-8871]|uniref:flagellar protein FlaG n=1 Tax=unclassified Paenibacillus TaxID=185978 RepID=UPI0030FA09F8
MNIQFSLTATPNITGQSGAADNKQNTGAGSQASKTSLIRDTRDMSAKEMQGVNVSIAEKQLIRTIEQAVKSLQGPLTTLEISIHEKTHEIMVKVLNKDTGELIREVPPEKTLDLVANMMEIAGILVDEKI